LPALELPPIDVPAAAERLGAAIRCPTISLGSPGSDPAALDCLHDVLESAFPRVHQTLEREVVGHRALLYRWRGTDPSAPAIVLLAHTDVVPVEAGTEGEWTHPPFSGVIADGFVWGRGSLDDKLGVMALLEAVEALLGQGFAPRCDVWLALGDDEEVGGREGARRLAQTLRERGVRASFVLDEGGAVVDGAFPGVNVPVALIGVAEKGSASLELRVRDPGGHSSMPPKSGAIGRLARALTELEAHPMPAELREPVTGMIEAIAPHATFTGRVALANLWLFEPLLVRMMTGVPPANAAVRTTTAPTMLEAGTAHNVLPISANALVNFRILPGDTVDGVIAHVRDVIDDETIEVACADTCWDPSAVSSRDTAGFRAIERAVLRRFPDAAVAPSLVVGATDSRWYEDIAEGTYRLLPVRFGIEDRVRLHGTDERLSVEAYGEAIAFYAALLLETAG
jgi:carboxypeptidase PM20D1